MRFLIISHKTSNYVSKHNLDFIEQREGVDDLLALFSPKTKIFTLSHKMFGHMHGVLNVENYQLHILRVNYKTNLLILIAP